MPSSNEQVGGGPPHPVSVGRVLVCSCLPRPRPLRLPSIRSLHGTQGKTRPWDLTPSSSTSGPTQCPHGNQTEEVEPASPAALPCFPDRL